MYVGQPEVAPLKFVRQPRVINAQTMQHRCIQVMHMHRIFDNVISIIIGLAVDRSRLGRTPGHPEECERRGNTESPEMPEIA